MREWIKEPLSGREYGLRTEGFYIGRSPKNWWHLYAQEEDGGWRYAAGGFTTVEEAQAAADVVGKVVPTPRKKKPPRMIDVELPT